MGLRKHDTATALANQLHCRIVEFGEADFVWHGRNRHSFNRLFLVTAGSGRLNNHTAGQVLVMRSGRMIFMPPGLDLEFDFPAGFRFYSLHFQLELLPGIDLFARQRHCLELPLSAGRRQRCQSIAAGSGWPQLLELKLLVFELAGQLCRRLPLDLEGDLSIQRTYGPLLDYLARTLSARTRIDELAAAAGRSRDRLSREFSRDFRLPLKEFLGRELCRRAEFELLCGSGSIKELADRLGFSSEFYFSRFFRRRTGLSPREFRRRHRRPITSGPV
ncbi:AraC family transcriptional regulator [Victivallis sp. Marseille-Q1083]|uniref:AraC family transcriptional regulator n=1 Tax=Victivallis sp. Marseille-Q1083 TaxID=2717288 RepID=UPI00158965A2|nr:AraC family transcriptional regulator [Victivallis sp. Marseille-Q1083]